MIYFIQVILYTAMMLLIYLLFLRNRPLYQFSRFYLLASGILPLLMPFIGLPESIQNQMPQFKTFELPAITITDSAALNGSYSISPLLIFYCAVSLLIMLWHIRNLYKIRTIIKKGHRSEVQGYVLLSNTGYGPGSFGKYIFFPGIGINDVILEHEKAHLALHHTIDILLLQLLQILCWPNLFYIWIKKELKQVHEFQADSMVGAPTHEYASLLLSSVFNTSSLPAMNLFIDHPIKRRIMMLRKKGGANLIKTSIKVGFMLSMFVGTAVIAQNSRKTGAEKKPNGKQNKAQAYAEKMPEPRYNLPKYLSENIKYPIYAKAHKIEGRVIVKFIVNDEGKITDPLVVRTPDSSLANEALRVVGKMPDWRPGEQNGQRVCIYYTLPISFKLQ